MIQYDECISCDIALIKILAYVINDCLDNDVMLMDLSLLNGIANWYWDGNLKLNDIDKSIQLCSSLVNSID